MILVSLMPKTVAASTFYVATDGNDGWSGRLAAANAEKTDGPLATLTGARNVIRKLKAGGPLAEPVEVVVAAGVYRLNEPIVFEAQDSGTAAMPIVYRAADGARPVLSGGRPITGFHKGEGPLWVVDIPQAVGGKWPFRQLFVNGRRACRARTPNEGYLHVAGLAGGKSDPSQPYSWQNLVDRFRFRPGDVRAWPDLNDVEIVILHSWNASRMRIASVDEKESVVRFTGRPQFGVMGWDPQQRYYIENVRESSTSRASGISTAAREGSTTGRWRAKT